MKILIITYYWPPSGGAGVQRWLKFTKYLPENGIEPIVITTKDGDYPAIDSSLEKDIPKDVKIIKTFTPTINKISGKKRAAPYGSLTTNERDSLKRRLAIWIRLNFIFPDARKIWNGFALNAAEKVLKTDKIDLMITTGPPHSTHLIGLKLKKKYNLPWIADFRDPWCDIDYLKNVKRSFLTEKLDRKLEQNVVQNCDLAISINHDILKKIGAEGKGVIIPNGFDAEDYKEYPYESDKFTISYFGHITPEREPDAVINALNKLYEQGIDDISLDFFGNVDDKERLLSLAKYDFIKFHNYIPHEEVMKKIQQAGILLLVINNRADNLGIITGKIFEYLVSRKPILALGPKDGEANEIIKQTKSGKMFGYTAIDEIADYIADIYKNGYKSSSDIEKYDRKKITEQLAQNIKKIVTK